MKIENAEVYTLKVPTGQRLQTAIHDISDVYNVFIKITSQGISGHGYAFSFAEGQAHALTGLMRDLAEVIQGADAAPASLETLAARRFNFVGPMGPAMLARSALDIASWDLLARSLNSPLYAILGGSRRPLPVYATGGWVTYTLEQMVAEAEDFYARGYRRYKIKLGGDPTDFAADLQRSLALRKAIPSDMDIMVDANQAWAAGLAVEAAKAFAQEGFRWFEEPIDADDYEGYARLRSLGLVDVAAGETLHGDQALAALVKSSGVDVLMPDMMRVGGVSGFRRILEATERAGVAVSSHTFTSVSTHAMTLTRLGGPVEVLPTWWDDVFEERPIVSGGMIEPSSLPGASSTPSDEAIARWRLQ